MRKQPLLISSIVVGALCGIFSYASASKDTSAKEQRRRAALEESLRSLPETELQAVEMEDLLEDSVHIKLASEGWSAREITRIMKTAIADKEKARGKDGYEHYAKEVVPMIRRMIGGDTLATFMDTVFTRQMRESIERTVPADLLNAYWPPLDYVPPRERPAGEPRNPGYFKEIKFKPSCGRIHWIAMHPEDPDRLYVVPDGCGIYKTDDMGVHWECITDKIPNRSDRRQAGGYAIPVDPDDWNHVFAFMANSTVYETCDGGDTWRKIQGATHKGFKRGDCFRDKKGNLKFIGCTTQNWNSTLWISEDTCKTWTAVQVPVELKDIKPDTGERGLWFQYIEFDPNDRDRIWLPTARSIFYFDDGAKSTLVNGQRTYNIKKLEIEVYDDAGNRRYANMSLDRDKGADVNNNTIFPCPANRVGDLVVDPNDPNKMWFATGTNHLDQACYTAVYYTEDRGRTWKTLQDVAYGIGSGNAFGNEIPGPWLGGFGVNLKDPSKVYGCTMSSAKSSDGGRTFGNFGWPIVLNYLHDDGRYIGVSASRHNADNHCIRSHKTGRVFRGSDGGMLMIDPNFNNGEWMQIGGDMGQMLFYHIAVNEFGDQVMAGNTQDIDGQTWRYGRWGRWRGYEGCESFINPYTSNVYLPNCGWQGWDPTHISIDSWNNAKTKADVVSGSWFMSRSGNSGRSFLRVDDLGHTIVNLEQILGQGVPLTNKFGLCRDKGRTTVYVIGNNNYYFYSTDGGNSFQNVLYNGSPAAFSNTLIATDPDNSDIFYFGRAGVVYRYYNIPGQERWEEVCTGVSTASNSPGIPAGLGCSQLLFHEGSGDLYFFNSGSAGIYILECLDKKEMKYAPEWRFWTKGYNSGKAGNIEINYTTQEMVLCDYGRGVWCADLEHPADRFFDEGFALKELSFKDGRRTIGIDTEWTIPLYYYFKWTVNGEEIDNPYQYLRRVLNPGDEVQLELTLRESPDVHTLSAVFVVPEVATPNDEEENASQENASFDIKVDKQPGQAIYSNGKGRVDLGYFDYFFNDFTIDFWIKPSSNGTILANRGHEGDAKGWELYLDNGQLKFEYAPRNIVLQPRYEATITQSRTVSTSTAKLNFGNWSHVAIVHERYGNVKMYINGVCVATDPRIIPEATLNNSMILSLFADGIETRQIEAAVDELKIWRTALTEEEVRREMHSTNNDDKDGLVAYWPFNSGILESDVETFSRHAPKSRVLAETSHSLMTVPTCARHVGYGAANSAFSSFDDKGTSIFSLASSDATAAPAAIGNFGVYAFDASQWQNEDDNLDTDFFDYHPVGYYIHKFDGGAANGMMDFKFYPVEGEFNPNKSYRLYAAEPNLDKQVWKEVGSAEYDADTKSIRVTGATLADITDKKLLIITTKPSIELTIDGIGADGKISIYNEAEAVFPVTAVTLEDCPEPTVPLSIESGGIFKPTSLSFASGKAEGELRFDMSKLGDFNTSVRGTLSSPTKIVVDSVSGKMRDAMIPMNIEVVNRIAPRRIGTALKMANGHADLGNLGVFERLNGNQNLTIMGWVRVDSLKVLNHGGFNIMTFLGNRGVTGIRINQKRLEYAQNGRVIWTIGDEKMKLRDEDLERWMHLAVVKQPGNGGLRMYLNGAYVSGTFNDAVTTDGLGAFHLGKNSPSSVTENNSDNFCGAYDQVAIWDRALSHEEVIKYMTSPAELNDPHLLAYMNMDYFNENDKPLDIYSLTEIKAYPTSSLSGRIEFGEETPIPFDSKSTINSSSPDSPISFEVADLTGRNLGEAWISVFRGTPYCYLNHDFQEYSSLNQDFYGITFTNRVVNVPAATDSITMTYRHRSILGDEPLAVAMRRTGTLDHLAGFVHATSVEPGVATFRIPASYLYQASEVMFFTYPDESGDGEVQQRPAILQMTFPLSVTSRIDLNEEVPTLVLHDDETCIPVNADVMALSRNWDKDAKIVVNETLYATPSQETIDFSATENQFNINLDLDKMDLYGINPITINLEGANANELRLNVIFEPYVLLTLENGQSNQIISPGVEPVPDSGSQSWTDDEDKNGEGKESRRRRNLRKRAAADATPNNTFRTTSPVANLEINAELLQGYLPEGEQVKLDVITDLSHSMSIGGGNLLKNESVIIDGLEHHDSDKGAYHEGWNLIGNPYLTNINLTKEQNVEYDPESITKFLYQCDPVTGNYKVFDMTSYNAAQMIHPFQSYFVQTMAEDAKFTVTPVAKEVTPSKRTRSYSYEVSGKGSITLGLSNGDGSKDYDSVVISYEEFSDKNFVSNEDAPKLWNITGSSPEIYVMSSDDKDALAITATSIYPDVKEYDETLNIGVKSDKEQKLRLEIIGRESLPYKSLHIKDNKTGEIWNLEDADWTNPVKSSINTLASDPADTEEVGTETKYVYHEFTAYPGDDPKRFTLGIQNDIPTDIELNETRRYAVEVEGNTCTVSGLQGNATVRIYTPNGLNMINQHTEAPSLSVYLEKGVFIVIINENGREYTSKILVQ